MATTICLLRCAHVVLQDRMPLRSYLESDEAGKVLAGKSFSAYVVCRRYWSVNLKEVKRRGIAKGGNYLDGSASRMRAGRSAHCCRLISYFGKGEMRERRSGSRSRRHSGDFGDQARASQQLADSGRPQRRRTCSDSNVSERRTLVP